MDETPGFNERFNEKESLQTFDFTLDSDSKNVFKMLLSYGKMKIFFFIESVKETSRYYELSTYLKNIQDKDKNLYLFSSSEKLVLAIKKCIESNKYKYTADNDSFKLVIENDFFDDNKAIITIPLGKNQNLVDIFINLKEELEIIKKEKNNLNIRNEEIIKNEKIKFAKESFEGSVILNEEEKIILSEWVDPKKPLKFNLVFSTKIDGSYASTKFHSNCDGVSPTIIIVKDTNGNKFGGYATSSWAQPTSGADYARDTDAFIFSLSTKLKYVQPDKFGQKSIYKNNSFGPTFGSGHCLYIANGCNGNTSSYTSVSQDYKTDNKNLLNNSGSTSFQVSDYEVYRVVFEL